VDEYDKPIIDYLEKDKYSKAKENQETLKDFYSILKPTSNHIRLLFITGVSKFSKVSIFSDLNHLDDLTLHPDYATLTGYREEELVFYFEDYLKEAEESFGLNRTALLEKMRLWYDGYSWDGENRVYNPFGVLKFLSQLQFDNFSAMIGSAIEIDDHWNVLANISLATRAPNASELFSEGLHHSASRIELGDLSFISESSKKFVATLQKKGAISFTVSPFFNLIDNFIIIEPTGVEQTIRGNFQVWEYRQTEANMMGIDFNFAAPLYQDFTFENTFSLVKGYDRDTDTPLINMPPVNFTNLIGYSNNGFSASIEHQYFFKQNEFPNTNFEVFIPETQSFELIDVSTPPDAYQLFGLTTNYKFNVFENATLDIGLKVQNIFNTSYRNYLNRLRYYADDVGRNILINTKINF